MPLKVNDWDVFEEHARGMRYIFYRKNRDVDGIKIVAATTRLYFEAVFTKDDDPKLKRILQSLKVMGAIEVEKSENLERLFI